MTMKDKTPVKKIFFFALFAIMTFLASAQNQINGSVKVGLGMGNILGNDMQSPKIRLAYKFGFGLECPFDHIWALQTGVSFVSKGTNHTIVQAEGFLAQAQVNALYLELPLMVAARFSVNSHTNITLSAGPYCAWGVGGKTRALGYNGSSSSRPDWDSQNVIEINTFGDKGLDLRRFDYGGGIGLSVEYQHYIMGVEGQMGLRKLHKELDASNITGFVTIGYRF